MRVDRDPGGCDILMRIGVCVIEALAGGVRRDPERLLPKEPPEEIVDGRVQPNTHPCTAAENFEARRWAGVARRQWAAAQDGRVVAHIQTDDPCHVVLARGGRTWASIGA